MNPSTFSAISSLIYNLVVIAGIIGALLAFRGGRSKEVGEAQTKLIGTLKDEIEAQARRISDLEKAEARQSQIMTLIRKALKQRGLLVTIDGDMVTILDGSGSTMHGSVQSQNSNDE